MKQQLSHRIINFYRAWQQLEAPRSLEDSYWVLVDDLCRATPTVVPFKDRAGVEQEADALVALLDAERDPSGYAAYTRAKLTQSQMHLEAKVGQRVTRDEIEARGMPWVLPSEAELEHLRSETRDLRAKADSALKARGVDAQEYFTKSLDAADAVALLQRDGEFWLAKFEEVFGVPAAKTPLKVEGMALAASFHNLVVTKSDQVTLLVNTNAGPVFTTAHLRFLALHEIVGHVLHFDKMRANADLQREAPHLACLSIHTADALHVEGIAQILSMALLREVADSYPEIDCQMAWGNLFMAVRHRNICHLVDGNITPAEAATHHLHFMGGETCRLPGLTKMYEERLVDPFACIQGLAYYASLKRYGKYLDLPRGDFASQLDRLMFDFLAAR